MFRFTSNECRPFCWLGLMARCCLLTMSSLALLTPGLARGEAPVDKIVTMAEAFERQFYGSKLSISVGETRITCEINEDATVVRQRRLTPEKDFAREFGTFVSLEIGQSLEVYRTVPRLNNSGRVSPIVQFLPTGGPTIYQTGIDGVKQAYLGFVSTPNGARLISNIIRQSAVERVDEVASPGGLGELICTHPSLGRINLGYDDGFRTCQLSFENTHFIPGEERTATSNILMTYEYLTEDSSLPAKLVTESRRSDGLSAVVTLTYDAIEPLDERLGPLIDFGDWEIPNGTKVINHARPNDAYVFQDGVVVALIDGSVVNLASSARFRNDTSRFRYYMALSLALLTVVGILAWKRRGA